MKTKILTPILLGTSFVVVLALEPAIAGNNSFSRNNYQSNGYNINKVKGGSHDRRGGRHRNDNFRSEGHHRSDNHHNTWYLIDGVLTQISRHHNHRDGERHHSSEHNHSSSNHR